MSNSRELKNIDLKNIGLKTTLPRLKILNLFENSTVRHLSAEDVYKELINENEDIGLATVYRVLTQFEQAGLANIQTTFLDIDTVFKNFEDLWNPFLGGQGPAPGYLTSLEKDLQEKIKTIFQKKLPVEPNGSIKLIARAIAVSGKCIQ